MPADKRCEIGNNGRSFNCKGKISEYESNPLRCSIQECNIENPHKHKLCESCGKLFLAQKLIIEKG